LAKWAEVFSDQVVGAAMIDRTAHHADIITLKGANSRLKRNQVKTLPSARTENEPH